MRADHSETEDLLSRHIAAFNSRDVDGLLADFAPGMEWVTGDYTVPAGRLREFFTEAMGSITPRLSLRRIIDGGDVAAVEMNETWTLDGIEKSAEIVAVFDVSDGQIARAKIYREGTADA